MPSSYVKKIAKEKGISEDRAEKLWDKAKALAKKEGKEEEYDYITGIFKKMVGEQMTFTEFKKKLVSESKFEKSIWMQDSTKALLTKIFKSKTLKAAISQYVKFKKKGLSDGEAMHKAAGMYGLESDRVFSNIIHQMKQDGAVFEHVEHRLIEEGEPTNTSKGVAPDQETPSKKKKKKKDEDDDDKDDNDKDDNGKDDDSEEKEKMDEERKTFNQFVTEAARGKGPKMPAATRRKLGKQVYNIAKQNYFDSVAIPLYDVDKVLRASGYKLVDIDGSDYAAIYTGSEGSALVNIGNMDGEIILSTALSVSWYRMPKSGRWEVNVYMT